MLLISPPPRIVATTRDAVGLIEAAYALEKDTHAWLTHLCAASMFELQQGLGVLGHILDMHRVPQFEVLAAAGCGMDQDLLHIADQIWPSLTTYERRVIASQGAPCSTATDLSGPEFIDSRPTYAALGIRDILAVRGHSLAGRVVLLTASMPRRRTISPAFRARWGRLAAHIGAASRLRASLPLAELGPDDAILAPGGEVADANGTSRSRTARDRLRQAAKNMDRARCRELRASDEALDLWQGLVAGRWSLVDRFDSDGRRFVVARRNEPHVRDPRGLTARERQVVALAGVGHDLKVIAYDLGLDVSTVSSHLRSALRKLHVGSRVELARLFGASPSDP